MGGIVDSHAWAKVWNVLQEQTTLQRHDDPSSNPDARAAVMCGLKCEHVHTAGITLLQQRPA